MENIHSRQGIRIQFSLITYFWGRSRSPSHREKEQDLLQNVIGICKNYTDMLVL